MQIQINSDHNLKGGEPLVTSVRANVEDALSRFSAHVTRVKVHLSSGSADKRGRDDRRCMMEAALEGHASIAVTHYAATLGQAIDGAAERLVHLLEHTLGRLHRHRAHPAPLVE